LKLDLHNVLAVLPDEFCVLKIAIGKQVILVGGFHAQALRICGCAPAR
jgi:hypothetical protein